jgi:hypothetical protein
MPWIVGIDEAGYGPNFGPLVMTAVACRVSDTHAEADLWQVFESAVCRQSDAHDPRFVVADSKLVYSPSRGLAHLERTVHAAMGCEAGLAVSDFIELVCPECHPEVRSEVWYEGITGLPVEANADYCQRDGDVLATLCKSLNIVWGPIRSVVVCPAAFNDLLERWDSKGAVLALSLARLLRALPCDDASVAVFVDKHGGRNNYATQLQPAFDGGLVFAVMESSERSMYQVLNGQRRFEITFQPRAEENHFCVALASMVSKYLREVLMLEFNRFWQKHLPGLKPTAGYPNDSKRFWKEIRPVARKLGIAKDALWRRK